MAEELAKYGWMVRVFARVGGEPKEQWFMAGFPDEAGAVAAVKASPKALAEATVTAHRILDDREIKDFGLRPGEAKQYA